MNWRRIIKKISLFLIIICGQVFFLSLITSVALAQVAQPPTPTPHPLPELVNQQLSNFGGSSGLGNKAPANADTPEVIAGQVIQMVLSFLGVIFLILVIYGGYLWMLARGNQDEVDKAKKIILDASFGLVVILSAYAATTYVLDSIAKKILLK